MTRKSRHDERFTARRIIIDTFGKIQPLTLAGSMRTPMLWMAGLGSLPIVALVIVGVVFHDRIGGAAHHVPPFAYAIPLVLVIVMAFLIAKLRRAGALVEGSTLVVHTGLGAKRIPLAHLRAHGVRIVDLTLHKELKPSLKLMGTAVPGFAGGWFRLRNGETAVCLLLDRQRVSYLRSDDDKISILLSLDQPEILRALLTG